MSFPRPPYRLAPLLLLALAACQQPTRQPSTEEIILSEPPSAGTVDCPTATTADWLDNLPLAQRHILPTDCETQATSLQTLFSWGIPTDYIDGTPWTFVLRQKGGSVVASRSDLLEPRLAYDASLAVGNYEWAVTYRSSRGGTVTTRWRRFNVITGVAAKALAATTSATIGGATAASATTPQTIPSGTTLSNTVVARTHPRVLPAGSTYASIAAAAKASTEFAPLFTKMHDLAVYNATRALAPVPATPSSAADLAKLQNDNGIWQSARNERGYMELLALMGKLENNATFVANAKLRVLNLAAWAPGGVTGEAMNIQANREIYLGLANGLDMLWNDFTAAERTTITTSLRTRLIDANKGLSVLDKAPYDGHGVNDVRWVNHALMLSAGLPGFPEAQGMLARTWDLGQFTLTAWGNGEDGSFANGIPYAWYNLVNTVPYVAAVRAIAGVDLYQNDTLRHAGDQLIAFTAPNTKAPSAFGDEADNDNLYGFYAATYFRLHAQLTRNSQDAWYWQANPATLKTPPDGLIWQLLLLGADNRATPAPTAPTQNSWFFPSTGYAAMHVDAKVSARTSVFFRSSPYGAYSHSHADQNAITYTSKGMPLLIGAGYYPWFNSPHHRTVTRATRFKNALTFDGGFGQSESFPLGTQPSAPVQTMDSRGELIYTDVRGNGNLSAVTGDATLAYRAVNSLAAWTPLLTNAVRSVVMDRANGVTLVYDWATSNTPRRWELNFHSPQAFTVNAATVTVTNGGASACLDRYGPATTFAWNADWPVAPEVAKPLQAHGRFAVLAPSTELAHLTVIRDSCRIVPVQVNQVGTKITTTIGTQVISFDKRSTTLPP